MKKTLLIFMISMAVSCLSPSKKIDANGNSNSQKEYFRHLNFLLQLKKNVARESWPEFSRTDFAHPNVYYTREGTYVLNPNEHIKTISEHQEIDPLGQVEAILLEGKYTDTINFQFSNSYSDTDSTAFYFRENVLLFQSFKLTRKFIPDINDIQDWSIMVIHELFHGYQRSFPEHQSYNRELEIPGGPDKFLGSYHQDLDWFSTSIERENELLKAIWIEDAEIVNNLSKYDSLRTVRIDRVKKEFGVDIREVEDYEIMMEGHARYFESLCKRYLSENGSDASTLTEEDKLYVTDMFEGYDITADKGLYNIYNNRYYYPLGFNISMILEKHLPEYRETIYVSEHNFNSYLEELRTRISD